jgi:predicted RNA binding protein YcfA (HicA-like mRNA interferase family)
MDFRSVLRRLKGDGWQIKDQNGSHVQMVHASKKGKITVPKHGSRDLKPGTLNAIWKQAGLKL